MSSRIGALPLSEADRSDESDRREGESSTSHTKLATLTAAATFGLVLILSLFGDVGGTRPDRRDVVAVRAAADQFTYQQLSEAWLRMRLGDGMGLVAAVTGRVPLRHRTTHQDGDAIIVSFAGRHGGCVDLVSRPDTNRVRRRTC